LYLRFSFFIWSRRLDQARSQVMFQPLRGNFREAHRRCACQSSDRALFRELSSAMLGRRRWVDHGIICSSIGDGARYGKLQKYHNFQQYFTSIFKNTTRAQWPQAQLILPPSPPSCASSQGPPSLPRCWGWLRGKPSLGLRALSAPLASPGLTHNSP